MTGRRYVPELDGIRGIAILMVAVFHFSAVFDAHGPFRILRAIAIPGWSGVDLFFVLSGYLITGILLDAKTSPDYFRRFYIRRILRIFPVYYVALLFCFTFGRGLLLPAGEGDWRAGLAYVFHVSNWLSLGAAELPNLNHFWSLAVEEQFYLVWPFAVYFLRRRDLVRTGVLLMVLAPALRFILLIVAGQGPDVLRIIYVLTPARADTIAFGALMAVAARDRACRRFFMSHANRIILGSAALLTAYFVFRVKLRLNSPLSLTLVYSILAVMYGLVVFRASESSGSSELSQRFLRASPLRLAGRYSYAAYVIHYLLLAVTLPWFQSAAPHWQQMLAIPYVAGGITATFLLAALSWHVMEKRILDWASSRRAVFVLQNTDSLAAIPRSPATALQ